MAENDISAETQAQDGCVLQKDNETKSTHQAESDHNEDLILTRCCNVPCFHASTLDVTASFRMAIAALKQGQVLGLR